jgi:RNA polymerase sigma-70 factor (ECF subfamily)
LKTDGELLRAAIAGDKAAYGVLVERYERGLRSLAFFVLRDRHLAEDVVQDAFIAGYSGLAGLRDHRAFGSWMGQIVRRQARVAAARRIHLVPLESAGDVEGPDAHLARSSLSRDEEGLLSSLMGLSEEQRQVLMLRYIDGHSVAEIAGMRGESVGTVTKRISRAHALLRQRWKECTP